MSPQSPPTPAKPRRLASQIAIALVGTLLLVGLPGVWVLQDRLERNLIDSEIEGLRKVHQTWVTSLQQRLIAATRSAQRLGALATRTLSRPGPGTSERFAAATETCADGCVRSRRDRYCPDQESGIWVPAGHALQPSDVAGFVTLKDLVDTYGLGPGGEITDTWILPLTGGEVVYWPSQPEFIFQAGATQDYTTTDWVQLTNPTVNPLGDPRWTPAAFDPVPRVWMISAVAPYFRDGKWAGSVGHDLTVEDLTARIHETVLHEETTVHLIRRDGTVLVSSTLRARVEAANGSLTAATAGDGVLDAAWQTLADRHFDLDSGRPLVVRTNGGVVAAHPIPGPGWIFVVTVTERGLLAGVRSSYRGFWGAAAVVLTLLSLVPVLLISRLMLPAIRGLSAGIARISAGDLEQRFELVGAQEFTGLTAELNHMTARLRAMVAEIHEAHSALALRDRQLQQAKRLEALGRMAGGVAHDFNNILTVILGYAERARMRADGNPAAIEELDEVLDAARRAASLVRQMLVFSRRHPSQPRALQLNDVILGVRPMLARMVGEDHPISLGLHPEPTPIVADPSQVEQVIQNLVLNARDAMPQGGPVETLTGRRTLPDSRFPSQTGALPAGEYVTLTVRDTGCGMDESTLSRIWEPFFTTKDPGKGTGLGLATVYGIVQQNGGGIEVQSKIGAGSTFTVLFPLRTEGPPPPPPPAPPPRPIERGTASILVVEDQATVRMLMETALSQAGYRVRGAPDAETALARIAEDPQVDLLLTDVIMPGMSGPRLAEVARELLPGLLVFYVTGYPGDHLLDRGIHLAPEDVLTKPFTPTDLQDRVRARLQTGAPGNA